MPSWIQKQTIDVEKLISNFEAQTKIIQTTDQALDAVELSLTELCSTLVDYRSRIKVVIGARQSLKEINMSLDRVAHGRTPNKDGNNVTWKDQPKAAPTAPKSPKSSGLGITPNLSNPFPDCNSF